MDEEFHFGPYVLRVGKRTVLMNGKPIPLGSRALDILIYLVRNAGELQTNAAIIKNSWPDTYVDEANLRVHISALRRALGDTKREPQFIANVPGRGYAFIGPLSSHVDDTLAGSEGGAERVLHPPSLIGRDEAVAALLAQLAATRLLTITGPGGIGKTAIARAVVERFGQRALWIDLAQVENGGALAGLVGARIDVGSKTEELVAIVSARLNERNLLLVLDSCEHIVGDVAAFAEAVIRAPGPARVLATSREPLRAQGERVHRVPPLDLPDGENSENGLAAMSDASMSSAVRLFVDRADACLGGYHLTDADAPFVVDICSRLDGIPLAIELAASRLETMGVEALALSLRDGFRVLSRGTRTALPRHRTLRATLDWSYDLLSEDERTTLQALSLARGWFTMEVVGALAGGDKIEDIVDDLVAKSLVVADARGRRTRFKLLDTTRHYAREKLAASGRGDHILKSAALFLTRRLAEAEDEILSVSLEEWSHDYGQHLPLVQLAAEWAFGETGDGAIGAELVVDAVPLFFRFTLMEESTRWATRAISVLEATGGDPASLMRLHAAVGWPAMRSTKGPDKGMEAWTKVMAIAEETGDIDFQLRAIWAMWVDAVTSAEPRKALGIAERFSAVARHSGDPVDAIVAKRLAGTAMHWLGRHHDARDLLQEMVEDLRAIPPGTASGRYHLDQGVTARITLARCHWMIGDRTTAFAEIETAVNEALAIKHEVSLTHVLAEAGCPLALLDGRLDLAREYTSLLLDHTESLSLDLWRTYARCFEAEIAIADGRAADGLPQLCAGLRELERAGFDNFRSVFRLAEAKGLAQLGQTARAIGVLDDALRACESSGERWCVPELLRVKGRLILQEDGPGSVERAHRHFKEALETAKEDGAVAWEASILSDLGQTPLLRPGGPGHAVH